MDSVNNVSIEAIKQLKSVFDSYHVNPTAVLLICLLIAVFAFVGVFVTACTIMAACSRAIARRNTAPFTIESMAEQDAENEHDGGMTKKKNSRASPDDDLDIESNTSDGD